MTADFPKYDPAFIEVLLRGAEKTFDNADRLFREAQLLAREGAIARALCLHQISLEECSKIENMGAWALSILGGFELKQDKVLAAFRRHEAKNKTNAYMLTGSKEEQEAKERGDWAAAMAEFRKFQKDFHEQSNSAKNASLYVDWKDGEFVSPQDAISPDMLADIERRNAIFLDNAVNSLRLLKRVQCAPADFQKFLVPFLEAVDKLPRDDQENSIRGMQELMEKLIATATAQIRSEHQGQPHEGG